MTKSYSVMFQGNQVYWFKSKAAAIECADRLERAAEDVFNELSRRGLVPEQQYRPSLQVIEWSGNEEPRRVRRCEI